MSNEECTGQIELRDGRSVTVRPLMPGDVELLSDYFAGLSETTRRHYGPHPFDRETADKLCACADDSQVVRFVAELDDGDGSVFIAYMILSQRISDDDRRRYGDSLDYGRSACLAPSVADTYQNQGLGTAMARHVLDCARRMGVYKVILMGGVVARNAQARRLYQKLGFREVRSFWIHSKEPLLNYDMVLDLNAKRV